MHKQMWKRVAHDGNLDLEHKHMKRYHTRCTLKIFTDSISGDIYGRFLNVIFFAKKKDTIDITSSRLSFHFSEPVGSKFFTAYQKALQNVKGFC